MRNLNYEIPAYQPLPHGLVIVCVRYLETEGCDGAAPHQQLVVCPDNGNGGEYDIYTQSEVQDFCNAYVDLLRREPTLKVFLETVTPLLPAVGRPREHSRMWKNTTTDRRWNNRNI